MASASWVALGSVPVRSPSVPSGLGVAVTSAATLGVGVVIVRFRLVVVSPLPEEKIAEKISTRITTNQTADTPDTIQRTICSKRR